MIPVVELPIDDFAWGMWGRELQRMIEAGRFDMRRVVFIRHGDPRHPTDQGGNQEDRQLHAEASDIPGCIEEALGIFSDLTASKDWTTPSVDTEIRIEASVWMGRVWIPIAILPPGTATDWQAIQILWPKERQTWASRLWSALTGWLRTLRAISSAT